MHASVGVGGEGSHSEAAVALAMPVVVAVPVVAPVGMPMVVVLVLLEMVVVGGWRVRRGQQRRRAAARAPAQRHSQRPILHHGIDRGDDRGAHCATLRRHATGSRGDWGARCTVLRRVDRGARCTGVLLLCRHVGDKGERGALAGGHRDRGNRASLSREWGADLQGRPLCVAQRQWPLRVDRGGLGRRCCRPGRRHPRRAALPAPPRLLLHCVGAATAAAPTR